MYGYKQFCKIYRIWTNVIAGIYCVLLQCQNKTKENNKPFIVTTEGVKFFTFGHNQLAYAEISLWGGLNLERDVREATLSNEKEREKQVVYQYTTQWTINYKLSNYSYYKLLILLVFTSPFKSAEIRNFVILNESLGKL